MPWLRVDYRPTIGTVTDPTNPDLALLAEYRAARHALRELAASERAAGIKGVTNERLSANARLDAIFRRVPWHLR